RLRGGAFGGDWLPADAAFFGPDHEAFGACSCDSMECSEPGRIGDAQPRRGEGDRTQHDLRIGAARSLKEPSRWRGPNGAEFAARTGPRKPAEFHVPQRSGCDFERSLIAT